MRESTGEIRISEAMKVTLQAAAADRSFRGFTKARVILSLARAMDSQFGAADPGAALLAIALFGDSLPNTGVLGSMAVSIKAQLRPVRISVPEAFVVLEEVSESKVRYFKPDEPGPAFLALVEGHILSILELSEK